MFAFFRLLQNLSHRLVSIPENDILLNSESSRNENNLTIENNSKNSSGNTSNQDIDIDILQVQDNITVDTDGKLVSSANSDSINNSSYNKNQESSETSVIQTEKSQNSESNNKNEMMLTTSATTTTTSSNEVENNCGSPNQLLSSIQKTSPLWWRQNLNLDKSKLILIGFSKGCVVLNQVSLL